MQFDVVDAIRRGDIPALESYLIQTPRAARDRIDGKRTLLHIATDWPGHFPNVEQSIRRLARHGAELNAPFQGSHAETPLHWAASSDDVTALNTLLDLGADIESPGAVIGNGTPLADAVAFGQWKTARRLIERGAQSTLWQSAALGLMDRVREHFARPAQPSPQEITNAFWCACHGGQAETAQFLLEHGGRSQLDRLRRSHSARCGSPQRKGRRSREVARNTGRHLFETACLIVTRVPGAREPIESAVSEPAASSCGTTSHSSQPTSFVSRFPVQM